MHSLTYNFTSKHSTCYISVLPICFFRDYLYFARVNSYYKFKYRYIKPRPITMYDATPLTALIRLIALICVLYLILNPAIIITLKIMVTFSIVPKIYIITTFPYIKFTLQGSTVAMITD